MSLSIEPEAARLQQLPMAELRARYAELFTEPTRSCNRLWLLRRILWRLQALAEGDLSERARRRADELAHDADLRRSPPRLPGPSTVPVAAARRVEDSDPRLPPPGPVLTRRYKGQTLQVQILAEGFAYQGQRYRSLSAVAKAITGTHGNGFLFFGLTGPGGKA